MLYVAVIEDPASAEVFPEPVRGGLPAARVGPPRQKADHHLKPSERHGPVEPVEPVEERREGDLTERPEAGAITA
ncbi:hypothetical protein [Streptosporangium roseum]|uniref:hypothetical protein n=1 Tax=Streptosporangium roseum TaxID=2001 RepID=UPI0033209CB9